MSNNTQSKTVESRLRLNKKTAPLAVAMIQLFEPLKVIVDTNPKFQPNSTGPYADIPHCNDVGMRIMLDQLLRTIHQQRVGPIINTKTNTKIDSMKDRLNKTEMNITDHVMRFSHKPEELELDPQTSMLQYYLEQNNERFDAATELEEALCAVWADWFNEVWAYGADRKAKTELTEEQKASAMSLFASLNKKKVA